MSGPPAIVCGASELRPRTGVEACVDPGGEGSKGLFIPAGGSRAGGTWSPIARCKKVLVLQGNKVYIWHRKTR
jgi:hypothetical protein